MLALTLTNIKTGLSKELAQAKANPVGYFTAHRAAIVGLFVASLLVLNVTGAFAADPTPSLNIDTDAMVAGLMEGANIILAALGVVMFLLIGMKLGGVIIRAISSAIDGLRI